MIKIFGFVSTTFIFSLFIWNVLGLVYLLSFGFFDQEPSVYLDILEKLKTESLVTPWVIASSLSAIIILLLFLKLEIGSALGGKIKISNVFDRPLSVFKKIKDKEYSMKIVILLLIATSALWTLFEISNNYVFLQAKYYSMLSIFKDISSFQISPKDMQDISIFYSGFIPLSITDFSLKQFSYIPLAVIVSIIFHFMYFFALAFLLYWLSQVAGAKIPYLNLYTLLVYLFFIPLTFLFASAFVNIITYAIFKNVSTFSVKFLPSIGYIVFYIMCIFGVNDLGDISLKRSFLVLSPFLIITLTMIYLNYFFTYVLSHQLTEIILWQLGL